MTRPRSPVTRAIVVATPPGALAVVAGLPLAVRAVLTLQDLGIPDVAVVAGGQDGAVATALARRGLRRAADWLGAPTASAAPVLVVAGNVLFDGAALEPLLASAERDQGRPLQIRGREPGVVGAGLWPEARVPELVARLRGGAATLGEVWADLCEAATPSVPPGNGLWVPLDADHPPGALADALLLAQARKAAAADGYLAGLLDRHLSRFLTRRLLGWPVTPNQVTMVSILLGLGGALGLATVSYGGRLGGVLALLASSVLDGVDGELARARREQTALGARLDLTGDYVVNLAAFIGLGIGLARQGLPPHGLGAALALLGGVAAAMATMHTIVIRPALRTSDDLHEPRGGSGFRASPVTAVVEKIAGRDYTYVLLVCALTGHLEWFLYMAAVGAWVFVVSLLGYFFGSREARGATS